MRALGHAGMVDVGSDPLSEATYFCLEPRWGGLTLHGSVIYFLDILHFKQELPGMYL